jgi:parallel beta-helix repeat protein
MSELVKKAVLGAMLVPLAISILTLGFNIQPAKASGTIYIRADGSIDPTNASISTFNNMTYTLTGEIASESDGIVIERDNITVDGAGYTLQGGGGGTGVDLSARINVTIENMQITGFYDGIILEYTSTNDSISGNSITANNDDGIQVSVTSTNNTISEDTITENGRFGIYMLGSDNDVSKNSIVANNVYGVYLDLADSNIFTGNTIENNGVSFWTSSGNVLRNNNITNEAEAFSVNNGGYVNDIDVSNTVNGKPIYYLVGKHDISVPTDAGYVALVSCSNMTVQDLNLMDNGQGILLADTKNSIIAQNNITNTTDGIFLDSCSDNNISGNIITNSGSGLRLYLSKSNSILRNNIATKDGVGVYLQAASDSNNVSSNNIANNSRGIMLEQCDACIISWNNITANKAEGINIWSCFNNIFFANEIANNDYGIYIDYIILDAAASTDNKFYHNYLINNTNQVTYWLNYFSNIWDDGYPYGGNFWSDYNGVDEKSGPGQNLPGSDAIGDTPYIISSNDRDNYPLMSVDTNINRVLLSVSPSKTVVGQGYNLRANVTITNAGDIDKTVNITVNSNSTLIGGEAFVNVTNVSSTARFFEWNTTGLGMGNYTISAFADGLSVNCSAILTIPGDLDGDFNVTPTDLAVLANAYACNPSSPKWNPNADINSDGKVSLLDLVILALHYHPNLPRSNEA